MKGRYRGNYRGRGRGHDFTPGTFELPPPFQPYQQSRGRGGGYRRPRRGRRSRGNYFSENRWRGIERKLAVLEKQMNELCKKDGVTLISGSLAKSTDISIEECTRVLNIVMSKLEKIDQTVAAEYKSVGLSRKKSEQKLLKELTIDEVVVAQERAFNRVVDVVEQ